MDLYIIESMQWSPDTYDKEWGIDEEASVFTSLGAAKKWLTSDYRGKSQYDGYYQEPYTVVDTDNYRVIRITVPVTNREEVAL